MRIKKVFFMMLVGLPVFSGCVREDLADCPVGKSGVTLKYDYLLNMDYRDLFGERVADVRVFFFDRDSVLCDTLTPAVAEGELYQGWSRQVELDAGQYTIVTWAGDAGFERSFAFSDAGHAGEVTIGQTRLADFVMRLKVETDAAIDTVVMPINGDLNRLFHGIQRAVVQPGEWTTVATSLTGDTKVVRVKVGKLSVLTQDVVGEDDFDIRLIGVNGQYGYDNLAPAEGPWVNYRTQGLIVADDTVTGELTTLRLQPVRSAGLYAVPLLTVVYRPTGQVVCENLDVPELILKAKIPARDSEGQIVKDADGNVQMVYPTAEYLDRQDLFEIVFGVTRDEGRLDFTVFVNGWEIQNIIPAP